MDLLKKQISSSFRDPSGFLFIDKYKLYRVISSQYKNNYDYLIDSGLYCKLVEGKLLIPHVEVSLDGYKHKDIYKIIEPELIPFISYSYEWCFSQLKDAALLLIKIQREALNYNMILKDASSYNIQFYKGRPILIDTLSFEIYQDDQPWVAYRQFCQHFLAPLFLMAEIDIGFNKLMSLYIDGIPIYLASKFLPKSTWLKFSILTHIHLHAKTQNKYQETQQKIKLHKLNKHSLIGLIDHLDKTIDSIKWNPAGTEWGNYYADTNYLPESMTDKKYLVAKYLGICKPSTLWDFGANTGIITRIASDKNIASIAFDIDPVAVEKNYLMIKEKNETMILPLCIDINNPSAAIGWANKERLSLWERGPVDMIISLALVHHLVISNNLPFSHIALLFFTNTRFLLIEYIPKEDSQVQRLLYTRDDIFSEYTQACFEESFLKYFIILEHQKILNTHRVIYLMEKRKDIEI